jgi:hypothetical protein
MKEFRMRAFFGILGLAGAGFLVSSVSTVGCGSDNKGGSTGTAGSSGSTGSAGTTGNAGTTGGGGNSGGNSGGGSGGNGGASGPAAGCTDSALPPPPAPVIADFAVVDGGEPVLAIGGTYKFASPTGAVTPTATVSGGAWHITLQAPGMVGAAQYVGVGLYFNGNTAGDACIDATQYTGVKFDLTGTIGGTGCSMQYSTNDSGHQDSTVPNADKKASGPAMSYAPQVAVTVPTGSPTVMVPFTSQMNGSPATGIVKDKLVGAQWQFTIAAATATAPTNCDVMVVIDNVSFY